MFALFAVGEATALEPGWWGHVLQVTAVGALAALAWRHPTVGGPLLVGVGVMFSVLAVVAINDDLASRSRWSACSSRRSSPPASASRSPVVTDRDASRRGRAGTHPDARTRGAAGTATRESTPEERAERRAKYLSDVVWHAGAFVIVNALLWTLDLTIGAPGIQWAFWITLFWGFALAFHLLAYVVDDRQLEQRKAEQVPRRGASLRTVTAGTDVRDPRSVRWRMPARVQVDVGLDGSAALTGAGPLQSMRSTRRVPDVLAGQLRDRPHRGRNGRAGPRASHRDGRRGGRAPGAGGGDGTRPG